MRRTLAATVLMVACGSSASAQWLDYPSPTVPRTADGQPALAAPPPRAADGRLDLSGVWRLGPSPVNGTDITAGLPPDAVLPWAERLASARAADLWKDDPVAGCQPLGPRAITGGIGLGVKIVHTPHVVVFLYEDMTYRQVFLDGRPLPTDPNPTFMGYSIGRWEEDTLVVDTAGFNDRTWLDHGGHPNTESLRITERIRRVDVGRLAVTITVADPGAYARPWTFQNSAVLMHDAELLEYVCTENERSRSRLVGRTEQERRVEPAPETLLEYVGAYEVSVSPTTQRSRPNPNVIGGTQRFEVTTSGTRLFLDMGGRGKMPLIATSENTFVARVATIRFERDERGVVNRLLWLRPVMGDVVAERVMR